jgi:hypothetical protein
MTTRGRWLFWLALLLVSAHFTTVYLSQERPFIYLDRYAFGHERGPYQQRFLMGPLLRAVEPAIVKLPLPHNLPPRMNDPWTLAVGVFVFPSVLLGTLATRFSLQRLTGHALFAMVAAFLFPLMAYFNFILPIGENYLLPYDIPSLAFFGMCLSAIILDKRWLYYPLFALACCNRETACFLTLFFLIAYWHRGERRALLAGEIFVQFAVWTAIYVGLRYHFRNTPMGDSLSPHIVQNVRFLLHPQQWPALAANFAFLWIVWLAGWRRIEPAWFRRAGILLPLWFAVMMLVGVIVEIRVFGEMIAYMSIAVALILWTYVAPQGEARTC